MTKKDAPRTAAARKLPAQVRRALDAVRDRQGIDPVVLDLRPAHGFTDHFLICSGQNPRHIKAIVDAVDAGLREVHVKPAHVEGYDGAAWVLLGYFDFIVHVFSPETRAFYALERLWGSAERVELPPEVPDRR